MRDGRGDRISEICVERTSLLSQVHMTLSSVCTFLLSINGSQSNLGN